MFEKYNTNYVQSQTPYSIISRMNNGWMIFDEWNIQIMDERWHSWMKDPKKINNNNKTMPCGRFILVSNLFNLKP
jgi:hypothetical protein